MSQVPSLITLCIGVIKDEILDENGNLPYVYKLPSELFDCLLPHLPPLALQNLQDAMPSVSSNDHGFSDDCLKPSRKRKRFENFDIAWETLYRSRWSVVQKFSVDLLPEDVQQNEPTTDWRQIYWERHLQDCLDAAAEIVSVTSFDGCLGEVEIPGNFYLLVYVSVVKNGVKSLRGMSDVFTTNFCLFSLLGHVYICMLLIIFKELYKRSIFSLTNSSQQSQLGFPIHPYWITIWSVSVDSIIGWFCIIYNMLDLVWNQLEMLGIR